MESRALLATANGHLPAVPTRSKQGLATPFLSAGFSCRGRGRGVHLHACQSTSRGQCAPLEAKGAEPNGEEEGKKKKSWIHFVGIGGSGLSALAMLALKQDMVSSRHRAALKSCVHGLISKDLPSAAPGFTPSLFPAESVPVSFPAAELLRPGRLPKPLFLAARPPERALPRPLLPAARAPERLPSRPCSFPALSAAPALAGLPRRLPLPSRLYRGPGCLPTASRASSVPASAPCSILAASQASDSIPYG